MGNPPAVSIGSRRHDPVLRWVRLVDRLRCRIRLDSGVLFGEKQMFRRRTVLGSVLVGALLAGGLLFGEQQPSTSKPKGKLPLYWSKLGLSDEQKKKASAIMTEYKDKIEVLKRE